MINDSYLEIHDDIIVIGVMYKYRLQLNMANYIYLASVADFKHHLYFCQRSSHPMCLLNICVNGKRSLC